VHRFIKTVASCDTMEVSLTIPGCEILLTHWLRRNRNSCWWEVISGEYEHTTGTGGGSGDHNLQGDNAVINTERSAVGSL